MEINELMKEYELKGLFDIDILDEMNNKIINPNDVDYLNHKVINKIKTYFANKIAKRHIDKLIKNKKLIIKEVIGLQYLEELNDGFILTCNHIHPYDNFALHYVLFDYIKKNKKKFYKVIKEGNYFKKGIYGFFFKNCNTLPISSNILTLKKFNESIKEILNNKDIILIYPEQSLWPGYKKPRPLKNGAFKFSCKTQKPILPCFITINESSNDSQNYTIHFSKPIYPKSKNKDEERNMMDLNFTYWKSIYEKVYNKPLKYDGVL